MQRKAMTLGCILLLSLIACQTDVKEDWTPYFAGDWKMDQAKRDGKPTSLLDKIVFKFEEGQMTTNFNKDAAMKTAPFEIQGNGLMLQTTPPLEFDIENASDSMIHLKTFYMGAAFQLHLIPQ